jgi:hypothetical protein
MDILATGRRIVGVGNSDSHFLVGQEPGYPRNYVLLDPSAAPGDPQALVDALRRGRVVVSYGPFIEFTLEGKAPGSSLLSSTGRVRGHIRVLAPSWVDVRRVTVYVNGVEEIVFMVKGRDRMIRFDEDFEIPLLASAFVMVKAEGEETLAPVLPTLGAFSDPVRPLAFTNPIWVEVSSASR